VSIPYSLRISHCKKKIKINWLFANVMSALWDKNVVSKITLVVLEVQTEEDHLS
jgi:hypothetical protein